VKSEEDMSDTEKSDVSSIVDSGIPTHHSGSPSTAKLILNNDGKVKLMNQNIATRQVVQGGILEAKAYVTLTSGYPELTKKASFSCASLGNFIVQGVESCPS
jgi:archaellum component FlaG (FlaF/FlaG flagellin family)